MSSAQTAELIRLLRPRKAIGIGFGETIHPYDLPLPLDNWQTWSNGERDATDCFGDLVRLYSTQYQPSHPVIRVTESASQRGRIWLAQKNPGGRRVIALNPGAGHPMKRWPIARFFQLARRLTASGCIPLFIFGPKETALCEIHAEEIESAGGLVFQSENYCVQPLAGVLQHCELLVSNDCAVMHVGAAVGCHVVAIFGPSQSRIWFPYSKATNRVVERDTACRQTCQHGCEPMSCLTDITTEEVFTIIYTLIAHRRGPTKVFKREK